MILIDVNVLVYAHRRDSPDHVEYKRWLEALIESDETYGMTVMVLSGFLRIVTHPKVFDPPSSMEAALAFANQVRSASNCVSISPGERHWDIFSQLCRSGGIKGNLVPDAFLAALAIESGSEWITTDRHFSRFKGLRWRHPLG